VIQRRTRTTAPQPVAPSAPASAPPGAKTDDALRARLARELDDLERDS